MKYPEDDTGQALQRIADGGSDMSKPMLFDFFIAVSDLKTGETISEELSQQGFQTEIEKDDETGDWTCYCSLELIPSYDEIVNFEKRLQKIADKYAAELDGFGSYGNA